MGPRRGKQQTEESVLSEHQLKFYRGILSNALRVKRDWNKDRVHPQRFEPRHESGDYESREGKNLALIHWADEAALAEDWYDMHTKAHNQHEGFEVFDLLRVEVVGEPLRMVVAYDENNGSGIVISLAGEDEVRVEQVGLRHNRRFVKLGNALESYLFTRGGYDQDPGSEIEEAIMASSVTGAVELIHGPPGTGKTYQLIKRLEADEAGLETLVCARTNIAVQNLFERAAENAILKDNVVLVMREAMLTKELRKKIKGGKISRASWVDTTFRPDGERETVPLGRHIVFSTISTSKSSVMRGIPFEKVVMDEACQVPMFRGLTLLEGSVEQLICAGDPMQLPGLASDKGTKNGLETSLMEFMIRRGYPTTFLDTQRRGHPDIFSFSSEHIYDGKLLSGPYQLPKHVVPAPACAVTVVPVEGTQVKQGTSWVNQQELAATDVYYRQMIGIYGRGNAVVIVPYLAQRQRLARLGIDVHTVDSFQGKEADCVIVSTVRKNAEGNVGFWSDKRRLNVAMTRAKHQLIIVGSCSTWAAQGSGILHSLHLHLGSKKCDAPAVAPKLLVDKYIKTLSVEDLREAANDRFWGPPHFAEAVIKALKTHSSGPSMQAWLMRAALYVFASGSVAVTGGSCIEPQIYSSGQFTAVWNVELDEVKAQQAVYIHAVFPKADTGMLLGARNRVNKRVAKLRAKLTAQQLLVLESMGEKPHVIPAADAADAADGGTTAPLASLSLGDRGGDGVSSSDEEGPREECYYRNALEHVHVPEKVRLQCDLNGEQARIAQLPGPVIVQGRSGTGKTEVLIGRVMAIATRGEETRVSDRDRSPTILVITRLGTLLDRIRDTLSRLLSPAAFQTVAFATEVAPLLESGSTYAHVLVDEVQDWPTHTLQAIVSLCSDVRGLVMVGDTAQTICDENTSFNFNRIKDAVWGASSSSGLEQGQSAVKPSVLTLTCNYRSHRRIVALGNKITDLIHRNFPDAIDFLGEETAVRDGPPVRRCQDKAWGAGTTLCLDRNQVCIVEHARLREQVSVFGLVLTPEEAKGLEFRDVLVVGFFPAQHRQYKLHRLTKENAGLVSKTPELVPWAKRLYVAVTRAKEMLCMWDPRPCQRDSPFEPEGEEEGESECHLADMQSMSTPEEWAERGADYEANDRHDIALKCFELGNRPDLATAAATRLHYLDQRYKEALASYDEARERGYDYALPATDSARARHLAELAVDCALQLRRYPQVVAMAAEGYCMPEERIWHTYSALRGPNTAQAVKFLEAVILPCGLDVPRAKQSLSKDLQKLGRWKEAVRVLEELGDYEGAAVCAEQGREFRAAKRLYGHIGNGTKEAEMCESLGEWGEAYAFYMAPQQTDKRALTGPRWLLFRRKAVECQLRLAKAPMIPATVVVRIATYADLGIDFAEGRPEAKGESRRVLLHKVAETGVVARLGLEALAEHCPSLTEAHQPILQASLLLGAQVTRVNKESVSKMESFEAVLGRIETAPLPLELTLSLAPQELEKLVQCQERVHSERAWSIQQEIAAEDRMADEFNLLAGFAGFSHDDTLFWAKLRERLSAPEYERASLPERALVVLKEAGMYSAAICLHLSRYDLPDISMELLKEAIALAIDREGFDIDRAGQSAEWLEVERCLKACSRRMQSVMTSPAWQSIWQSIYDHIFSLPRQRFDIYSSLSLATEPGAHTVVKRIFLLFARRDQEVLMKQILDTLSRASDLEGVCGSLNANQTLRMMTSLFKSLSSYPPGMEEVLKYAKSLKMASARNQSRLIASYESEWRKVEEEEARKRAKQERGGQRQMGSVMRDKENSMGRNST